MKRRSKKIPIVQPYSVRITASPALPLFKNSCPGKTARAVSSSGLPRKIEGINARIICVIVRETIKIAITRGEKRENKEG